jgi:uncharacterized protein YbjT (DUF2867 family)
MTELRAGIIVGAGSAAFEVMRDMVYNLPVLTPPRWVRSRTTPIALENLLYYLVALLDHPAASPRTRSRRPGGVELSGTVRAFYGGQR